MKRPHAASHVGAGEPRPYVPKLRRLMPAAAGRKNLSHARLRHARGEMSYLQIIDYQIYIIFIASAYGITALQNYSYS